MKPFRLSFSNHFDFNVACFRTKHFVHIFFYHLHNLIVFLKHKIDEIYSQRFLIFEQSKI